MRCRSRWRRAQLSRVTAPWPARSPSPARSKPIGGNLDFASYVTGNGTFTIDAGATLEFDGLVSTGSVVSFAASTGTLIIEQSASFQGEVSGILASGDVLDLGGLLSNGNIVATQAGDTFQTSASYDSVHGTTLLTVTDATHGQSTFLTLAGDYSTSTWSATSDGHGGVDIVDPPAAAPSPTIASGGSLEIGNAVASTETVTFQGSTGSLTLDTPSSFHGTIAGFTGDGTLQGSDQIDLKGIDYHSSSFAESFNAAPTRCRSPTAPTARRCTLPATMWRRISASPPTAMAAPSCTIRRFPRTRPRRRPRRPQPAWRPKPAMASCSTSPMPPAMTRRRISITARMNSIRCPRTRRPPSASSMTTAMATWPMVPDGHDHDGAGGNHQGAIPRRLPFRVARCHA